MRRGCAMLLCLFLAVCSFAQQKPQPQVMVVGVYHFDNPNRDLLNIRSEGHRQSRKRSTR
jgi:hypothetical protein